MAAVILLGLRSNKPSILMYEGYRYEINRSGKNALYWRCCNRSCRASAKTDKAGGKYCLITCRACSTEIIGRVMGSWKNGER